MDKDIASYIRENDMLRTGDCVIAAVSGGADSMCMLFCLSELSETLSFSLKVVHVNHGIRGSEADVDEEFVRDHCQKRNIPFSAVHADVPAFAHEGGTSLEEAARTVRYDALFKAARDMNASTIALAHNKNDLAETVLLNLLRGSGITGGAGIRPVTERDGIRLIRPLLSTSREHIEELLRAAGISFRTDSTNLSHMHTRNRIRLSVMPLLTEQVNSRSTDHLCEFARDMASCADYLSDVSRNALDGAAACGDVDISGSGISISVSFLRSLHPVIRSGVIRLLIPLLTSSLKDVSRVHINSITGLIDAETSRKISLPYGLFAERARDAVFIGTEKNRIPSVPADRFFTYRTIEGDEIPGVLRLLEQDKTGCSTNKNCTKWFDYDNMNGDLCFRYPEPGDRMPVLIGGEIHRKEIVKVFREAGITSGQSKSFPIAVCHSDVIWIPGIRRCDAFPVTADTRTILEITYK